MAWPSALQSINSSDPSSFDLSFGDTASGSLVHVIWSIPKSSSAKVMNYFSILHTMCPSTSWQSDLLIWSSSSSSVLPLSQGWELVRSSSQPLPWASPVHFEQGPLAKTSWFVWSFMQRKTPTAVWVQSVSVQPTYLCPLYSSIMAMLNYFLSALSPGTFKTASLI